MLRPLAPLIWTVLLLLGLEVALELRATSRGHRAVLLMREPGVATAASETGDFGPAPDFPYRSRIVTPAESAGAIWLSSSSYGEDVYVPVEDLFATRLAEALGRPVINASRGGITVPTNTRELGAEAPGFAPAVALLYQMSNDLDQISSELAARSPGAELPGTAGAADHRLVNLGPLFEELTAYRHIQGHVSSRLAQHLPLWDTLHHADAGRALFRARVEAYLDQAATSGVQPVLLTFATAYTPASADAIPGALERQNLAVNTVLSGRGWVTTIADWNTELERIGSERGVPVIDLAGAFSGRAELFRDLWHFTPAGHAEVGAFLAEALLAAGVLE